MVGVQKRRRINQKKGILGVGVKHKLLKRQRKSVDSSVIMEEINDTVTDSNNQPQVTSTVSMDECQDSLAVTGKVPMQKPIVRENKLRRNALPLQVSVKTAPKPNMKVNVVHARPISKKKAKKLLKATRRSIREKKRIENAMEC